METKVYEYNGRVYDRIIFDVGANNGSSTIQMAYDPRTIVFAFEPTPKMIEELQKNSHQYENYIIIPKAVSNYNGTSEFNIAGQWDWGCSSLLEFSDRARTEWPGRTDFRVTEVITVDVIRLDDFIEEYGIPFVTHLHIDTQGSDLKVLEGMGEYLNIVQSGVMESGTRDDILYIGQNRLNDSVRFLINNGFNITGIYSNDVFCNEVNIQYKR
jgi:FkbM family methyltransferase